MRWKAYFRNRSCCTLSDILWLIHFSGLQDAVTRNLLVSDRIVTAARVLAINASTGTLLNCAWWQRQGLEVGGPRRLAEGEPEVGQRPDPEYPWCVSYGYIPLGLIVIISWAGDDGFYVKGVNLLGCEVQCPVNRSTGYLGNWNVYNLGLCSTQNRDIFIAGMLKYRI